MATEDLTSLVDLLLRRAALRPEARAYTFLLNGENAGPTLTYAELDRRARALAALLQERLAPGDRVLLLYPPGLEFIPAFFGCLYAGVMAVPTHPPNLLRPSQSLPRLQGIVAEAGIRLVLCAGEVAARLPALFGAAPALAGLPVVKADQPVLADPRTWEEPLITPDTLALLQYTSGSTAAPKGVMVSHGNLIHNLTCIREGAAIGADNVGVSWLPVHHDLGLLGGILQPLFVGFPSYLMAPVAFVEKPLRWLQAVTRYRATLSGGPNFAYDLCVDKIPSAQRFELDLSSWNIAYNGAEPIRQQTLERFVQAFAGCGFRGSSFHPVYGLAESTLLVAGRCLQAGPSATTPPAEGPMSCGPPAAGTEVVIVDPHDRVEVPPGQVGEIWLASSSVARGYWNRPEETERTFHAHLADTGAGPFLRTGDLGFLQGGELFVTGRHKDLIIIHGRKHHPHDIEKTVEASHPALRRSGSAALSVITPAGERLLIVAEIHPRHRPLTEELEKLVGAIRQAVARQYEVQTHAVLLVPLGGIPRTTSGKLQRHACRQKYLEGTLQPILHWPRQPEQAVALRKQVAP